MRGYEQIFIGVVESADEERYEVYCEELSNKPYLFYHGIVVFKGKRSKKCSELQLKENDKVKLGVYMGTPEEAFDEVPEKYDENELYCVDVLEKLR